MPVRRKLSLLVAGVLLVTMAVAAMWWHHTPSPEQVYRNGWDAMQRGDWPRVSACIQQLRGHPSSQDQVRILRGGLLLRTGHAASAIEELNRVPGDGTESERALLLLCESFYSLKMWMQAEAVAQEVLRRQTDEPEAHRWLGAIYFDLGAMSHSEEHLKKLAELRPQDYSPHRLLGLIHKDFERYREAIADYHAALERHPPEKVRREILVELAKSQMKHNDFVGASKSLELPWPAEAIEPRVLQAECLWSLGQKEVARQTLTKLQSEKPRDSDVLRLTARFAVDEGRPAEAIEPLRKIITADPYNDQALMELSAAYRRLGKEAEAEEFLERRNSARALMEEFVDLNKRAIKEPSNAQLRDQIAEKCDQLGKKELAVVWRDAARALREQVQEKVP